jgi:hypothetical protein
VYYASVKSRIYVAEGITKMKIGVAFLLVVALTCTAAAQDAPAVPKLDENLNRVMVSVTEALGRAVTGLTKQDFQLWENELEQKIDSFSPGNVPGEYVLAYKPTNSAKDGSWRTLRVEANVAHVALVARLKSGYFAPASDAPAGRN